MCDFDKGCNFINIPKGVKTGIGLKPITPTINFSTVSNPFRDESVYISKFIRSTKSWRYLENKKIIYRLKCMSCTSRTWLAVAFFVRWFQVY